MFLDGMCWGSGHTKPLEAELDAYRLIVNCNTATLSGNSSVIQN